MTHLFENILKITVGNLLHNRKEISNSNNKIGNNFYGLINFINNPTTVKKRKNKDLSKIKEIKKLRTLKRRLQDYNGIILKKRGLL